jgi:amidohydrolase
MTFYDTLKAEAQALFAQLVVWRRDFHRYPELGFAEVRTAGIVADHLRALGLEVTTGVGKTGVVALIEPDELPPTAPTVLLRFDMDALPIHEQTGLPFASANPGVMHACGHDGHTAIGMGVARLLTGQRQSLPGRVMLVFQPAEETTSGAAAMIADGIFRNIQPEAAFGLHLWSRLPLYQTIVQAGPLWASAGRFEIKVQGRGGHGAIPHETVDATLVASTIVVALQSIVARNIDPAQTAVVSVGQVRSGEAWNIIAEQATLVGTIRSFDATVHDLLVRRITAIAEGIATAHEATATVTFPGYVPATINAPARAALMERVAAHIVGPDQVAQITPMMVGEDMAEFLNRVPGCYILLGASDPAGPLHSPHHNPTFDFDERTLPVGVALLAGAAIEYLNHETSLS